MCEPLSCTGCWESPRSGDEAQDDLEAELLDRRTNEGQMTIDEEVKVPEVHALQQPAVWRRSGEVGDERAGGAAELEKLRVLQALTT